MSFLKSIDSFAKRNTVYIIPVFTVALYGIFTLIFPQRDIIITDINAPLHVLYLNRQEVVRLVGANVSDHGVTKPFNKIIFEFNVDAAGNVIMEYYRGSMDYSVIEPRSLLLHTGKVATGNPSVPPGTSISLSNEELQHDNDDTKNDIKKIKDSLNNHSGDFYLTLTPSVSGNHIIYDVGWSLRDPNTDVSAITSLATKTKPVPPYKSN